MLILCSLHGARLDVRQRRGVQEASAVPFERPQLFSDVELDDLILTN